MSCFWCRNPCWSHPFPCWCIYIDIDLTSIEIWTDIGLQEPRYVQIPGPALYLISVRLPGDLKFHKVISSSSTRHSTGICLIKDIILHEHLQHSLVSDHSHHSDFIQYVIIYINSYNVWISSRFDTLGTQPLEFRLKFRPCFSGSPSTCGHDGSKRNGKKMPWMVHCRSGNLVWFTCRNNVVWFARSSKLNLKGCR